MEGGTTKPTQNEAIYGPYDSTASRGKAHTHCTDLYDTLHFSSPFFSRNPILAFVALHSLDDLQVFLHVFFGSDAPLFFLRYRPG